MPDLFRMIFGCCLPYTDKQMAEAEQKVRADYENSEGPAGVLKLSLSERIALAVGNKEAKKKYQATKRHDRPYFKALELIREDLHVQNLRRQSVGGTRRQSSSGGEDEYSRAVTPNVSNKLSIF